MVIDGEFMKEVNMSEMKTKNKAVELKEVINYTKNKKRVSETCPYITDCEKEKLPVKTKMRAICYLANNDFRGLSIVGAHLTSPFTGKKINAFGTVLSDDEYVWTDDLWIYVRDHDLKLPDEFIEKVNAYFDSGNGTTPIAGAREVPFDGREWAFAFDH